MMLDQLNCYMLCYVKWKKSTKVFDLNIVYKSIFDNENRVLGFQME